MYCKILQSVILIGKIIKMMDELVDFGVSYFLDKSVLVSSDQKNSMVRGLHFCAVASSDRSWALGSSWWYQQCAPQKAAWPGCSRDSHRFLDRKMIEVDGRMACSPLWMDDNIDNTFYESSRKRWRFYKVLWFFPPFLKRDPLQQSVLLDSPPAPRRSSRSAWLLF